jgi:hypothetical protein
MKVDFSLSDSHKVILHILLETKEIRVSVLEKLFLLFRDGSCDIKAAARLLKPAEPWQATSLDVSHLALEDRPSWFERNISGLEFLGLVELLSEPNPSYFIQQDMSSYANKNVRLTEEGQRIAQRVSEGRRLIFRPKPQERTSVFVACAFGRDDIDVLYEKHLEKACTDLGYDPVRIDMNEPPQTITESIVRGIVDAACVLADLTYARPSVYFEVGFCHGLGVPLLLTCRRDHYRSEIDTQRVHFDLEQFKISFWSCDDHGRFHWNKHMKPGERLAKIIQSRNPKK